MHLSYLFIQKREEQIFPKQGICSLTPACQWLTAGHKNVVGFSWLMCSGSEINSWSVSLLSFFPGWYTSGVVQNTSKECKCLLTGEKLVENKLLIPEFSAVDFTLHWLISIHDQTEMYTTSVHILWEFRELDIGVSVENILLSYCSRWNPLRIPNILYYKTLFSLVCGLQCCFSPSIVGVHFSLLLLSNWW